MNGHPRPPAWTIPEHALHQRRPVTATYHGHPRLLCPHTLGWKNAQAKLLAYQANATSSHNLNADPHQRWRSLLIDELTNVAITTHPWHTTDNYTPHTNDINQPHTPIP